MTSLTMTQMQVEGRASGDRINVTVQPSTRVGQGEAGVYVEVNDHYTVEGPEGKDATSRILDLLDNEFEGSLGRAERIIDTLMSLREQR